MLGGMLMFVGWRLFLGMVLCSYLWQLALAARGGALAPQGAVLLAWAPLALAPLWAVWSSVRLTQEAVNRGQARRQSGVTAWVHVLGRLLLTTAQILLFTLLVGLGALWLFHARVGVAGLVDIL